MKLLVSCNALLGYTNDEVADALKDCGMDIVRDQVVKKIACSFFIFSPKDFQQESQFLKLARTSNFAGVRMDARPYTENPPRKTA
jgi:hypothetical protein